MTMRLITVAFLLAAPLAAAQAPPLAFEVASIRVNTIGGPGKKLGDPLTPVGTGGVMTPRGTLWRAGNATVRTLIRFAYGNDGDLSTPPLLEEYRVVGGPLWIGSEAFDVEARMPEGPRGSGDSALMLRALLATRFALEVHTETRELAVYALVREVPHEAPGDRLRRTSGLCVTPGERVDRERARCGIRGGFNGLSADGASMSHLARALSPIVGRPVVDRTGLLEGFDFVLRFAQDPASTDPRFPSIFTGLTEQLGLKLEPTRAPVEVLVIDRVERPSDN